MIRSGGERAVLHDSVLFSDFMEGCQAYAELGSTDQVVGRRRNILGGSIAPYLSTSNVLAPPAAITVNRISGELDDVPAAADTRTVWLRAFVRTELTHPKRA